MTDRATQRDAQPPAAGAGPQPRPAPLRTGFAFAFFGAMTLLLAGVAVPVVQWIGRRDESPELRAQRVVRAGSRLFVGLLQRLGLMRLSVLDASALEGPGPRLLIANHPTLIDVLVLFSLLPQADCVVSAAHAERVFLRGLVSAAGFVSNRRGALVVEDCLAKLRAGRTVLVFPEGTRSPPGGIGPFQRGAARIALASGQPLRPVLLTCDPPALTKEQNWYDTRPFHVTVRSLAAVTPDAIQSRGLPTAVAAKRLTAELHETFAKGLESVGDSNALDSRA